MVNFLIRTEKFRKRGGIDGLGGYGAFVQKREILFGKIALHFLAHRGRVTQEQDGAEFAEDEFGKHIHIHIVFGGNANA